MSDIKVPAGFEVVSKTDATGERYLTKPGDTLQGIYLGEGEKKNSQGESIKTFRFQVGKETVEVFDRVRLRTKLRGVAQGWEVFIQRLDPVKVKERSVNDYMVAARKPATK